MIVWTTRLTTQGGAACCAFSRTSEYSSSSSHSSGSSGEISVVAAASDGETRIGRAACPGMGAAGGAVAGAVVTGDGGSASRAAGMGVEALSTTGGGGGALLTGSAMGTASSVDGGGGDSIPGGINGSTPSSLGDRLSWGLDPGDAWFIPIKTPTRQAVFRRLMLPYLIGQRLGGKLQSRKVGSENPPIWKREGIENAEKYGITSRRIAICPIRLASGGRRLLRATFMTRGGAVR